MPVAFHTEQTIRDPVRAPPRLGGLECLAAIETAKHMFAAERLISRLELITALSDEERAAINGLTFRYNHPAGKTDIVREGDRPSSSFIILEGFVATSKVTGAGRRAVTALHVPGDMPDLMSLHLRVMDCNVQSISGCVLGFVDHDDLRRLCRHHPRLSDVLWTATLMEAAVYREGVVNIGHRSSVARLAHLFCELLVRCTANKRLKDTRFELPLTQLDLADMTGMSTVHVNRSLQVLRGSAAISYSHGTVVVHNWRKLSELADFDAGYLHLPASAMTIGTEDKFWSLAPERGA